jgi:hypothetical protein
MNDPKDEKSVMAILKAMAQATIKNHVARLDKSYHPDRTYSYSTAMNQTKPKVLNAIIGPPVTESMTFHDASIRIYGNVALVRGRNELRNGTPGSLYDNHLNILWMLLRVPARKAGRSWLVKRHACLRSRRVYRDLCFRTRDDLLRTPRSLR